MFIFSWLLMIAVVILFVTGGATYTEVCHPVVHKEPSSGVIRVSNMSHCDIFIPSWLSVVQGVSEKCANFVDLYFASVRV